MLGIICGLLVILSGISLFIGNIKNSGKNK